MKTFLNIHTPLPEIKEKIEKKKIQFNFEGKINSSESKPIRGGSQQINTKSKDNLKENLKYDDYAERQMNSMLIEELEKKFINPELLLRATNKVYDHIDKKQKNLN